MEKTFEKAQTESKKTRSTKIKSDSPNTCLFILQDKDLTGFLKGLPLVESLFLYLSFVFL